MLCCVPQVHAASDVTPRMSNYQYYYGISNVRYYITDTVLNDSRADEIVTYIDECAKHWEDTGYGWNPLYISRTEDLLLSSMDFYIVTNHLSDLVTGTITYWNGDSYNPIMVDPTTSNWVYTEISLYMNMPKMRNGNFVRRTISHFMGHSFGLGDNDGNPNSVMCDFYAECNVCYPGLMDHKGLNAIYNN